MGRSRRAKALAVLVAWVTIAALLLFGRGAPPAAAQGSDLPITGPTVESLAAYDEVMTRVLAQWQVPGGALAVMKGDRLVLARGYGLADRDAGEQVRAGLAVPDRQPLQAGHSSRGAPARRAGAPRPRREGAPDARRPPASEASVDPRIWEITVRQLLQHTGGWDRAESADPFFPPRSVEAAQALGAPQPASCETLIRYAFTQPLDFDPGTRFGYGNLSYCILGRIVERVTGTPFADYAQANVLGPAGAGGVRIGGSTPAERGEREVRYYDFPGAPLVAAEAPGVSGRVPRPDGGVYLGRFDSAAAWVASPIEYAKFAAALFGRRGPALLRPETVAQMTARPAPPVWDGTPIYYGLGWMVRPLPNGANIWHFGGLNGTRTVAEVRQDGVIFVALFNSRPPIAQADEMIMDVERSLIQAGMRTQAWPEHDLFDQYP